MFESHFEDAVKLRLRSDVTVGLSLSGGVDSTCILGSMTRAGRIAPLCLTATYGTRNHGEAQWAKRAGASCNARVIPIEAPREEWLATLPRISSRMDAPGYSPAVYPSWKIMGAARDLGIGVMLEGQGADEAFGGYPQYAAVVLLNALRDGRWASFRKDLGGYAEAFSMQTVVRWLLRESFPRLFRVYRRTFRAEQLLRRDRFASVIRESPEAPGDGGLLADRLAADFTRAILPGLLHYSDAISMGQSIESRLPFMDYRLVEWAFSQDDSRKVHEGVTKVVLREYLRRVGLVEMAERREKQGFPTPVPQWLAEDNGAIAREWLLSQGARIRDYCSGTGIKGIIERHVRDPASTGDTLYKLLSTESWLRECIPAAT
jgi:asparagine synthase (glutamine-hydrolysing)